MMEPQEAASSDWTVGGMSGSYQTHTGDAGVVSDVGDVEHLSFILAAGFSA